MDRKAFAKKIADELDVSRPVTVLLFEEGREMVHEVLSRISPTSRLVIIKREEEEFLEDERLEMHCGILEDIERIMSEYKIETFDATIVNTSAISGGYRAFFARIQKVLKPSGILISSPFPKDARHSVLQAFSAAKEIILWRGLLPVRVLVARSRVS